jgi:hypothetical protein
MAIQLARWINLTDRPITFVKGVSGVPWPGCDSQPGGVVEAPEGYERTCLEAGYTRLTPDLQASMEEAQIKAMIAEDDAKVGVKSERVEAPSSNPDQLTLGAVSTEPEAPQEQDAEPEPEHPAVPVPAKGRRRGRTD